MLYALSPIRLKNTPINNCLFLNTWNVGKISYAFQSSSVVRTYSFTGRMRISFSQAPKLILYVSFETGTTIAIARSF